MHKCCFVDEYSAVGPRLTRSQFKKFPFLNLPPQLPSPARSPQIAYSDQPRGGLAKPKQVVCPHIWRGQMSFFFKFWTVRSLIKKNSKQILVLDYCYACNSFPDRRGHLKNEFNLNLKSTNIVQKFSCKTNFMFGESTPKRLPDRIWLKHNFFISYYSWIQSFGNKSHAYCNKLAMQ